MGPRGIAQDIIAPHHTARSDVRESDLEFPHHVFVGMIAVVNEYIDGAKRLKQRGQFLARVARHNGMACKQGAGGLPTRKSVHEE